MARMHEVINELHLSLKDIPDLWEPYFIAAQQKYAGAAGNEHRFDRKWFRQLNRWLNFEDRHMEAAVAAAAKIKANEMLYEWSQFIRYLIFDSRIIRQDEAVLDRLLPHAGMGDDAGMFLLLTVLSGADTIVERYKLEDYEGGEIEAVFALIPQLMDRYYRLNKRRGMHETRFLLHLAWSEIWVFDGMVFRYTEASLPGDVYRNSRSGEWVMVAKPEQLYDKEGRRLSVEDEETLIGKNRQNALLIDDSGFARPEEDEEGESAHVIGTIKTYPEGVWESRFFHTETGGFVGNALGPDGLAHSAMRVFDAGYWKLKVGKDSHVLKVSIMFPGMASAESFKAAVEKALAKAGERELPVDAVVMESWILDPALLKHLAENHSLRALAELFKLYPLHPSHRNALLDTFGEAALKQPKRLWPENTPMQMQIKSLWTQGVQPCDTGGYFVPDTAVKQEKTD